MAVQIIAATPGVQFSADYSSSSARLVHNNVLMFCVWVPRFGDLLACSSRYDVARRGLVPRPPGHNEA
eukprot:3590632-Prymnesium_polylepis.1